MAALLLGVLAGCAGPRWPIQGPFAAEVADERPRVFIRRDGFDGLTIRKLREWVKRPEFARRRYKLKRTPHGRALEWMIDGKREDLDAAVAGLKAMGWKGGNISDQGMNVVRLAALYDWVRNELDEPTRTQVAARIEQGADYFYDHIVNGRAPFYYSRTPGALAAVTIAGIALQGDSPKAARYLRLFRTWGVNEFFQTYDWVDSAATGGRYTFYYTYVDLGHLLAAWWSATGRNPAPWIREHQGDWLGDIVRFYLWYMRPGISFTDCNDQRMSIWNVKDQFSQGLDLASYLTRDGYGRSLSRRWNRKCGVSLYHSAYMWNFMFRDPTVAPRPLTDLPRAAVFGRDSCGYAFFRSSWPRPERADAATHVYFRAGDPMNVHGSVTAGQFQVFRHAPLASRSGIYTKPYDCRADQYHRNAISTNVILFTDPRIEDDRGDQLTRAGTKWDHATWAEWSAIRKKAGMDVARIADWQVTPREARCRVDLSKANPAAKCRTWVRELVWLGYQHLVVLDIVETARPDVKRLWQLHCDQPPMFEPGLVRVGNRPPTRPTWSDPAYPFEWREGRLFCQILAPARHKIVLNSRTGAREFDPATGTTRDVAGDSYHRKYGKHVVQLDPGNASTRTVFVNVLTATDASAEGPPKASLGKVSPRVVEVSVGKLKTRLAVPKWFQPE